MWPGDSAGVEEDSESVVLEGPMPVAAALHPLDAQVEGFGRSVRADRRMHLNAMI